MSALGLQPIRESHDAIDRQNRARHRLVEPTILASTIVPAKGLEHLFLRVLPRQEDKSTSYAVHLRIWWRPVVVIFNRGDYPGTANICKKKGQ